MSADGEGRSDHNRSTKRKYSEIEGSDGGIGRSCQTAMNKMQKLVWTGSLQNRFLKASGTTGFSRYAPNNSPEKMNVPGLNRQNVGCMVTPSFSLSRLNLSTLHSQTPQQFPGPNSSAFSQKQVISSSCQIAQSRLGQPRSIANSASHDLLDTNTSVQGNTSSGIKPNPNPLVIMGAENVTCNKNCSISTIKHFLDSEKSSSCNAYLPRNLELRNKSVTVHDQLSPMSSSSHDQWPEGERLGDMMREYEMALSSEAPHAGSIVENVVGAARMSGDEPLYSINEITKLLLEEDTNE